tara:strand:- start:209 stop:583 length:375 start_codon:yes stop_codon:yes gene_type:complete
MVKTYQVEVNAEREEFWRLNGEFHCEHGPAVRNLKDGRIEDVYYLNGNRFCSRQTWMDALMYDAVLKDLQVAYEVAETVVVHCDNIVSEIEQEHSDAVMAQVSATTASVEAFCKLESHRKGRLV